MIKLFNKSEFVSVLKNSTMYIQDVDGNNIAIDIENYSRLIDNILIQRNKSVSTESFMNEPFKPTANSLILGNKILPQYFRNWLMPELNQFEIALKNMIDSIDIELATKYLSYTQVADFKSLKEGKYLFSIEERRYDINRSEYEDFKSDQIYSSILYDLIDGKLRLCNDSDPMDGSLNEYDFKLTLNNGSLYENKILNKNSSSKRGVICKRYIPSTMLTLYSNKGHIAGGYIIDERYNHSTGMFNLTHSDLTNSSIDIKCMREANNHYSTDAHKYCINIKNLKLSDIPALWYESVSNNDLGHGDSTTIKCVEILFGTLGWSSGELYAKVMKNASNFNIKFKM